MRQLRKRQNTFVHRRPIAPPVLLLLSFAVGIGRAPAGPMPTVELKTEKSAYEGRIASRDKRTCWILSRRGELNQVVLSQVKSFRKVASKFRPLSMMELRDQLVREYGRDYDVAGRGRYLVVAPRGRAKAYARLLDGVYRSFHAYFSVRGFRIDEPEFPLVAIVFPDRKTFDAYCRNDGVPAGGGLRGYYLTTSNRVALYDPAAPAPGRRTTRVSNQETPDRMLPRSQTSPNALFAKIEGSLKDTIVHEATHQIAFNTGLHAREGGTPSWIIEGLACVFEAPGIHDAAKSRDRDPMTRINRSRYVRFQARFAGLKSAKTLRRFIGSDRMYERQTLDAYAYGWALTFFLIETRPSEFARYLQTIASRDSLTDYTRDARLTDFRNAFGADIERLESEYVQYFKRLK